MNLSMTTKIYAGFAAVLALTVFAAGVGTFSLIEASDVKEQFLSAFEAFQGDQPRRDDVTIVGFEARRPGKES